MQSVFLKCILKERLVNSVVCECCCSHFSYTTTVTWQWISNYDIYYKFTYKHRKIIVIFSRYFSAGFFAYENCATFQTYIGLFFNVCGRVSPSDAESTASEQSSGRETGEESVRPSAVANEGKPRRAAKKGLLLGFFFSPCGLYSGWRVTLVL